MKTSTRASRILIVTVVATAAASSAHAQLYNPLDTVPKPNAVIAHDVSVTMGIEADCSSCHRPGDPRTRLDLSKQNLLDTLPLFRDYFVFGGFQYSGCGYAKINGGSRILPTPTNPDSSYNAVFNQVANARHCSSRENFFPSGGSSSGCLTATPQCVGDFPIIQQLLLGSLSGFNPGLPWANWGCVPPALSAWCSNCSPGQVEGGPCYWSGPGPLAPVDWPTVIAASVADPDLENISTCIQGWCNNPVVFCDGGGSYQVQASLLDKVNRMQWPRWYEGTVDAAQVQRDLCDPLEQIYADVASEMSACSTDIYVLPPNLSANWCDASSIAAVACQAGSPFYGTCVCDNTDPMCQTSQRVSSDCGTPLTWKARQQVAVCETYDTSAGGRFGSFYRSQRDNTVNAGGCRENVAMFFTDGYMGGTPGTASEAATALPTYASFGGLSNMFVFRVSNVFAGDANAMSSAVSRSALPQAYLATDLVNMQVSFARVLNRVYKGVYNGSALGNDTFGTRVALHSFTVPGYTRGSPVGDDYLGWPARISWHEVNVAGDINPAPIFETDWTSKANGTSSCGGTRTLPGSLANAVNQIGPGGAFRNGVPRNVTIPSDSSDRNGDGTPDRHPSLTYGEMFSIASTKPIVVEAPRVSPEGTTGDELITFIQGAARERPRMIYVMSNGYLHAFEAGRYTNRAIQFGNQKLAFSYDDSVGSSGAEVFRYAPRWLDDGRPANDYDYNLNNLVQQPMITGQLTSAEVRIRVGGRDEFRTVVVGAQGKTGRGMFAVDVTDPCTANVLAEWTLPNPQDKASGEPAVYTVRMPNDPTLRPVTVMTGGLGGSASIYVHDISNGNLLFQAALPGGASYPTAPVCADATGEGRITHCYMIREDGLIVRAEVRFDGRFGRIDDITPAGVGGGGARFSTQPAVFFGPDGAPNLVFASGDFERLTTPGGQDFLYKVIDGSTRRAGVPNVRANLATACGGSAVRFSGKIALAPGERVISPPVVAKGVIAVAGYSPTSSGCAAGTGSLYAMRYDTCADAIGTGPVPAPTPTGNGIPSSPTLLRGAEKIVVTTSEKPTGAQTETYDARTQGGKSPVLKRLYWRPEGDVR